MPLNGHVLGIRAVHGLEITAPAHVLSGSLGRRACSLDPLVLDSLIAQRRWPRRPMTALPYPLSCSKELRVGVPVPWACFGTCDYSVSCWAPAGHGHSCPRVLVFPGETLHCVWAVSSTLSVPQLLAQEQ